MMKHPSRARRTCRGNATVVAAVTLLAMGGLAGVILTVSYRNSGEINASLAANRAFLAAQAGANHALANLALDGTDPLGDADDPVPCSGASYWVEIDVPEKDLFVIRSHGAMGLQDRALEVVAQRLSGGPFRSAIFAGNSSGDPNYELKLGGDGGQRDEIDGNVYSGGDVSLEGDAEVTGIVRAGGVVQGVDPGGKEEGKQEPIPDLAGMNYETTADIQVASEFGAATYASDDAGGSAWQLPEENPAHIFRKNPSDRTSNTSATVKDDFFLEDPYETLRVDSGMDGSDAYHLSLSGIGGEPGPSSNQKVFFVDGNLWLHNKRAYSFKFDNGGVSSGLQVTFVVKGNIYFSDNLFYTDAQKDGVAFIAMKDEGVADSGNIYFGDPDFGTLERMYAFLYAENNFHDYNLDASGSTHVELFGNMTAGNHILINRDYSSVVDGQTVVQHTKLSVDFDKRITEGDLDLPGLPGMNAGAGESLVVLSWREVALQ